MAGIILGFMMMPATVGLIVGFAMLSVYLKIDRADALIGGAIGLASLILGAAIVFKTTVTK